MMGASALAPLRRFRPVLMRAQPSLSSAWGGSGEADGLGEGSGDEDGSAESVGSANDGEGLGSVDATGDEGVGVTDAAAPSPPRAFRTASRSPVTAMARIPTAMTKKSLTRS